MFESLIMITLQIKIVNKIDISPKLHNNQIVAGLAWYAWKFGLIRKFLPSMIAMHP